MDGQQQTLNRRLIKYLLLFFLISFAISFSSAMIAKWEGNAYNDFTWSELQINLCIRYISKAVFIFAAILIVRYISVQMLIPIWVIVLLHFIFGISLTFYSVFIQLLISNFFLGNSDPITWNYIYNSAILGTDYNFFLYFCAIGIVYGYYFFQKQKNAEVKESQLKTQLLDAKINALQTQLQPHFLFNTLNDIISLIDVDKVKSQDAIADLSDLLRTTLYLKDTKFISVGQEVALAKKYLEIEKIRFDNKLKITFSVAEDVIQEEIPPLLLQPILENSIKHGFSMQHDSLKVKTQIFREENLLVIVCSNNGKPIKKESLIHGTGISNVISRLQTLYVTNFIFQMENNNRGWVVTSIKIPL